MSVVLENEHGLLAGPELYSSVPTLEELVQACAGRLAEPELALLGQAYAFAQEAHQGQVRASGAPYFSHVAHVALELARLGLDGTTLSAALLHDVLEDTSHTPAELKSRFGQDALTLVEGVTKISTKMAPAGSELHAENLRKMLVAMARDMRVLLIKLSDRLHNVRTLTFLPVDKQRRVAAETMEVYAPLANRLGIARWKWELEDRCMAVLYPKDYAELSGQIESTQGDRKSRLNEASERLAAKLEENGVHAEISGRSKHLWSTWQKMLKFGKKFDEIYDLVALRVIVRGRSDCYATTGLVHSLWNPVPGRFKDYIAIPKSNMYQSLHTTVMGPRGLPLEVQVRTEEMHRTAEQGIAAHWTYKTGAKLDSRESALPFLESMLELQKDAKDSREFLELFKIDLFEEEVFVFTPKGEVKMLPKGASCIDFAYAVHSSVGDQCYGAVVNGKMAPLREELQSGDIVKVLTSSGHKPSKDWLHFVKTSKAKNRIRHFLKAAQHEVDLKKGKEALEKGLRRAGAKVHEVEKSSQLLEIAHALHLPTVEELCAALGAKTVALREVLERMRLVAPAPAVAGSAAVPPLSRPAPRDVATVSKGVVVKGLSGMLVAFARCCNPVHGDSILGYVTVGRGVSVHRTDCVNAADLLRKSERLVEVQWADRLAESRPVELEVLAFDREKLMTDMLMAVAKATGPQGQSTALTAASAMAQGEGLAIARFTVSVFDLDHLKRVMLNLHQIQGVSSVKRRERRLKKRVNHQED